MRRKKGETFKQYEVRRKKDDLRIKEHLKGKFIHISKRTLSRTEKGKTYLKPKE